MKCWVASGPNSGPESTQFSAPAARVDTCSTQLDVLQTREPQTESKLSHATDIDPSGAITLPSKAR